MLTEGSNTTLARSDLRYELLKSHPSGARAGLLHTRRGIVKTPSFDPTGGGSPNDGATWRRTSMR